MDMDSVFETPSLLFIEVTEYYADNHAGLFDAAMSGFMTEVDADPALDSEDVEVLVSLAVEWFAFDYVLPSGITPFHEFIQLNPEHFDEETLSLYREVAESQFVADFWLTEIDLDTGRMVLRPIHNDAEYLVVDKQAASIFGEAGALGIRLAMLAGKWVMPGSLVYYSELPADVLEEINNPLAFDSIALDEPRSFIEMVKDCFGPDSQDEVGVQVL
ncbi:MAG: hypothetical protein FWH40_03930 [Coriobacteriia bacterium]|nr:hypothetical protein [Coriobacteriia bacterium]MCL2136656.1 hypothetical protein [Coriobacteriia bacterium]